MHPPNLSECILFWSQHCIKLGVWSLSYMCEDVHTNATFPQSVAVFLAPPQAYRTTGCDTPADVGPLSKIFHHSNHRKEEAPVKN